jgi:NitT/TauT family transport system substrate-binding protein
MKQLRIPLIIALVALLLAACAPSVPAPVAEPVTLKIAVLPIIDALPIYVAQQQGLFAKLGVNVELVPVASAPSATNWWPPNRPTA